jgi:hypothetical protein
MQFGKIADQAKSADENARDKTICANRICAKLPTKIVAVKISPRFRETILAQTRYSRPIPRIEDSARFCTVRLCTLNNPGELSDQSQCV